MDDEFMLCSQAALRLSTGNFEMLVFQMLSAGNIGQPGAPGTVVVELAASEADPPFVVDADFVVDVPAGDADALAGDADPTAEDADAAPPDAGAPDVADTAQPLTAATATAASAAATR